MAAVIEEDEARAHGGDEVGAGAMGVDGVPPGFSVAVDGAAAADGNVLGVGCAEERLQGALAQLLHFGIVGFVLAAEQGRARIDFEGDVTLEHDRSGEEGPRRQAHGAAAFGRAGVDSALNGVRIFGDAIALGAIGRYVTDARGVRESAAHGQRRQKEGAKDAAQKGSRGNEIDGLRHEGLHFLKACIARVVRRPGRKHPSGAEAHESFYAVCGTAEAVPFQNRFKLPHCTMQWAVYAYE